MKLSVITICLNDAVGIDKTIRSVLDQKFRDFEYIIIDGGSTDGSVEVIKNYDLHITRWLSEKDTGIYNAMNKGIRFAKGEYILFLNSGDYFYNNTVLGDFFGHDINVPIAYGYCITTTSINTPTLFRSPRNLDKFYLARTTIPHQATFIKREVYEKIGGFDETFRIAGDYDFLLRAVIRYRLKSLYVPVLCAFFDKQGISSTNHELRESEKRRAREKNFTYPDYIYRKLINDMIDFLRQVKKKLSCRK